MNERKRNIAVGITALVGLVGLLVMMLLFGYVPQWLERTYTVKVQLPHASGLTQGSRARLNGIDVGAVERVHLPKEAQAGVIVVTEIRQGVRLPKNVQATVFQPVLGGGPSVEFNVTQPVTEQTAFLPTDGTARVQGTTGSMINRVTKRLRGILDKPIQQLDRVAGDFKQLSNEWTTVGQRVNRLIEPRTVAQVEDGGKQGNLSSAVKRFDARLAQMQRVLDDIEQFAGDEKLKADIRETAANAREVTGKLSQRIDKLSGNINENVAALRKRYIALADDLSKAVGSMQQLADRAQKGEGTVGKLMKDPQLYNNLNDTVQRMQKAIDDLRLLIQKWKSEGLPVQF